MSAVGRAERPPTPSWSPASFVDPGDALRARWFLVDPRARQVARAVTQALSHTPACPEGGRRPGGGTWGGRCLSSPPPPGSIAPARPRGRRGTGLKSPAAVAPCARHLLGMASWEMELDEDYQSPFDFDAGVNEKYLYLSPSGNPSPPGSPTLPQKFGNYEFPKIRFVANQTWTPRGVGLALKWLASRWPGVSGGWFSKALWVSSRRKDGSSYV